MAEALVCTVCDDRFLPGAEVLLYSLLRHVGDVDRFDFTVFYDDAVAPLSEASRRRLRRIVPRVRFVAAAQQRYATVAVGFPKHRPALLKLEMFRQPSTYRKILHLDADMLCLRRFDELLEGRGTIALADCRNQSHGRFNTGLIVLDGAAAGETQYRQVVSMIHDTESYMLDQPIINRLVTENGWRVDLLSRSYNFTLVEGHPDVPNERALEEGLSDVRFLHWAGHADKRHKPWERPLPGVLSWELWDTARRELHAEFPP